jgi:hypothetical protein
MLATKNDSTEVVRMTKFKRVGECLECVVRYKKVQKEVSSQYNEWQDEVQSSRTTTLYSPWIHRRAYEGPNLEGRKGVGPATGGIECVSNLGGRRPILEKVTPLFDSTTPRQVNNNFLFEPSLQR